MTNATRAEALPRTGVRATARSVVGAGAVVAAASVGVNALGFLVPLLGARLLSPAEWSALAALLALGAVTSVVGVGLQTALAVRWAKHDSVRGAGRVSMFTAGATTGALLVAVPVLAVTLNLPAVQPVLLAVLTFPIVLAGRWLGELQGRRRYALLAGGLILLGLARLGGMLVALLAGAGVTAALAVGAVGAFAGVVAIAALAGHGPRRMIDRWRGQTVAATAGGGAEPVDWREVVRASTAAIAMLAVSYGDLLLARAVLPEAEAAAYAVGSILTKGAIWAPSALTVLALPAFAQARRNAVRITLACTAACGLVLVVGAALFSDLAVRLAGGKDYGHVAPYAAGFAIIGALYALVYVFVNAEIAALARRPALWLWLGLAGLGAAVAIVRPSTVGGVLVLSMLTAAATTAAMASAYLIRRRGHRSEPEPVAADPAPPVV
jgi:O-antigen/teichoic acid export membrane protein